jgi:hypothetical protein
MTFQSTLSWLAWVAGWLWTIAAGGGGLMLLIEKGPWPPTNGWFALLSGIAACPLITLSLKEHVESRIAGSVQFAVAALFFVAGHIALNIWPH